MMLQPPDRPLDEMVDTCNGTEVGLDEGGGFETVPGFEPEEESVPVPLPVPGSEAGPVPGLVEGVGVDAGVV